MSRPICGKWHGNDVMPREFNSCIFRIRVADNEELMIGCQRRGKIVKLNLNYDGNYDFICNTDAVIRWCYIDLNY